MIWLNIKGYGGEYQLSEKGELRRRLNNGEYKTVKSCTASNGKKYITLWENGERKVFMLHNIYAKTFKRTIEDSIKILYEGYDGIPSAKNNVRLWLLDILQECERDELKGNNRKDEILYLNDFLTQLTE